ncbi:dolichyl-diphosphooligosaccharide--protein glycosyltransferase subunit 1B [Prunus avium]|uniref:Dolichyl-diphosphooligosaccharide--protein glycosyltransferase subunit 1 n=2 Tax=Prunus avium TaxID=42229 RepID=A0A6P5THP8_PRUAV|nr:dolichyl-diphosphooligosaccharide--protein glycosyltransferase subunit 1B [Prunus avium]
MDALRSLGRVIVAFWILSHLSLLAYSSSPQDLQILNAERRIDLSSHIVKVFLTLKVENTGASPVSEVLLAFPPTQVDHIASLKAALTVGKKKRKSYVPLEVNPTDLPDAPNQTKYFSISLLNPLNAGETATLEVLYILTHSLEPFPAEINQAESQLVYYRDSAIILSPYYIKQQTTFIRTPSTKVESFTRVESTNRAGTEIKYGPYKDRPAYSYSPVIVHFENNKPFAVVEELVREVEISHWGNLQITEHYRLSHAGARHKGVFSRLTDSRTAIFQVVLPEGSKDPSAVVPFSVKQHLETKYSYLDVAGRTVVVLEKENVVPEHNSPFQVYYSFNPIFMLAEPLMLVSTFFFVFMASIAYLHIDFSICKTSS